MAGKRGLWGHKRIITPIGDFNANLLRRLPENWGVGCICGWASNQLFRKSADARMAYSHHLSDVIDNSLFTCKYCGVKKPASEMRSDYRYQCTKCCSRMGNEWQRKNPGRAIKHKRRYHLRTKFGITLEDYELILASQGGTCAICQQDIVDSRGFEAHIDHDHATQTVRGILCFGCNAGLGQFRDDVIRLKSAIAYLNYWNHISVANPNSTESII